MKKPLYLLNLIGSFNIWLAFEQRGATAWYPLMFTFVVLPALEWLLPVSDKNLTSAEEDSRKNDLYFDLILWMIVPLQWYLMLSYLNMLSTVPLSTSEYVGLMTGMGVSCGVLGINAAHELGHRNTWHEQLMARVLLSSSLYWHFVIEHNKGHHKHVSTPLDPATARKGETLYAFIPRSIWGGMRSAWKIDRREMLLASGLQASLVAVIFYYFGTKAGYGFLGAAFVGVILLETVNYIEHYGLMRREISPGKFEKVQPYHSWNADHPVSRAFLFDLSRHSDHHYNVARKYQILRHHPESLQMPTGYPGMMLLSAIPPLWFKIMNPRIPTKN